MSENNDLNENSLFSVKSQENTEAQPPMPEPQAPAPMPEPQAPAPMPEPQAPAPQAPAPMPQAPAPMPQAPAPQAPAPMPQAPAPQAPAPMPQAPAPQAPAPMPQAPAPQVPMGAIPVAQPSPFVTAGQIFFQSMITMISGFPGKAMKTVINTPQSWIVGLLFSALSVGLFAANSAGAGANTVNRSVRSLSYGFFPHMYDFGFSDWISFFLIFAISGAILVVVRAAMLKFSALIMGQSVPYTDSLVVASLSASWLNALLLISGFLVFIAPAFFILLTMLLTPFFIYSEIATYIGLVKQTKFVKSPLVPYALLMPLSYPIAFSLSFILTGNMG